MGIFYIIQQPDTLSHLSKASLQLFYLIYLAKHAFGTELEKVYSPTLWYKIDENDEMTSAPNQTLVLESGWRGKDCSQPSPGLVSLLSTRWQRDRYALRYGNKTRGHQNLEKQMRIFFSYCPLFTIWTWTCNKRKNMLIISAISRDLMLFMDI